MFPRVVVGVHRGVRRPELVEQSGPEIEARWHEMMHRVERADRQPERRLAAAERALNRLGRS